MRCVIQRVKNAKVEIDSSVHGSCGIGYMILVGIEDADTKEILSKMADKISNLRIFEDENGKMNLNIHQVNGSILSISQFTLYADCHKGNRPSFVKAGSPDKAKEYYLLFNEMLREREIHVEEGIFGADMQVSLLNDGPVTILLDSSEIFS